MIDVFIPFTNHRVWVPPLTGPTLIRLAMKHGPGWRSKTEVQPEFESWIPVNCPGLFDIEAQRDGAVFKFTTHKEALLFKLTWGGR